MGGSAKTERLLSYAALGGLAVTALFVVAWANAGPAEAPERSGAMPGASHPQTEERNQPTQQSASATPSAEPSAKPSPSTAPSAKPPSKPQRYVVAAMGDSLTDERAYPHAYMRQLREACPKSRWDNYGVGGNMVNQMRRRFDAAVLSKGKPKYTHLIVFGGVNDVYSDKTAGRTPKLIQRDLSYMYERGRDAGIKIVALTITPWGGFKRYFNQERMAATRSVNAWIRGEEGGRIDQVVDAFPLLSCGEPEKLCDEYMKPFKDGLHFGKLGHELLKDTLLSQVFPNCE